MSLERSEMVVDGRDGDVCAILHSEDYVCTHVV